MAEHVLQAIEQAEKQADLIIAEAKAAARDILKATDAEIAGSAKVAASALRETAAKRQGKAQVAAQDEIHSLQIRRSAEREVLKKQAMAKVESAGALVFERVVNNGDR